MVAATGLALSICCLALLIILFMCTSCLSKELSLLDCKGSVWERCDLSTQQTALQG